MEDWRNHRIKSLTLNYQNHIYFAFSVFNSFFGFASPDQKWKYDFNGNGEKSQDLASPFHKFVYWICNLLKLRNVVFGSCMYIYYEIFHSAYFFELRLSLISTFCTSFLRKFFKGIFLDPEVQFLSSIGIPFADHFTIPSLSSVPAQSTGHCYIF